MVEDKIILGIDPGTTVMGYGIIHIQKNKMSMLNFGIIQLSKLENHPEKLKRILDRLNGLIMALTSFIETLHKVYYYKII